MFGRVGENEEIARRGLDALARQSFEEAQRLCTEEVELWTLFDQPGTKPEFSGRDGLRHWFDRLAELWAFIDVREVEVSEREGGWVMMRVVARVRGRGSPHDFEPRVSVAMQIADRKIAKFGLFPNQAGAEAMFDAG